MDLFNNQSFGAEFSNGRNYRYALWRIWDNEKPLVMFVGLNPSTANETGNDNTIKRVIGIANRLGYGGLYMMNCFPLVSTNPKMLNDFGNTEENDRWLREVGKRCDTVVFAWGAFKEVVGHGRDIELMKMFPNAKALEINKGGSPKHPLFCRLDTQLVDYTTR